MEGGVWPRYPALSNWGLRAHSFLFAPSGAQCGPAPLTNSSATTPCASRWHGNVTARTTAGTTQTRTQRSAVRLQGGCRASKRAGWGGAPDGAGLSRSLEALSQGGGTPKADSNSVPLAVAARFVCPPNRPFRCKNDRVCLWIGRQCDGTDNCGDGTDEEDCGEQGASEGGSGGCLEWGCCTSGGGGPSGSCVW